MPVVLACVARKEEEIKSIMIKKEETKLSLFMDEIQLTLEQQGVVKGVKGGGSTSTQWDVSSLYPWFLICRLNQLWIMPYYSMYLLKKKIHV